MLYYDYIIILHNYATRTVVYDRRAYYYACARYVVHNYNPEANSQKGHNKRNRTTYLTAKVCNDIMGVLGQNHPFLKSPSNLITNAHSVHNTAPNVFKLARPWLKELSLGTKQPILH